MKKQEDIFGHNCYINEDGKVLTVGVYEWKDECVKTFIYDLVDLNWIRREDPRKEICRIVGDSKKINAYDKDRNIVDLNLTRKHNIIESLKEIGYSEIDLMNLNM